MCEAAADYYEDFFKEPTDIYHPHPYTDAPEVEWENFDETIPIATLNEVLNIVHVRRRDHAMRMGYQTSCLMPCQLRIGPCS